ncbi:STAS domain-containing protein [Streptomyces sp. NPDC007907]|uniref:STAS domain-containing protein n=1 Tax=Streptomyces sp. NPDC007907 TaxID=3364789 RepID=UPI0036EC478B
MTRTEQADRPDRLSVEERVVDGVRVVTIRGELDHDVYDKLSKALLGEDEEPVSARIVADLTGVTFMDSSGLNAFLATHRQVSDTSDVGWVRIASAQDSVLRVLQMTGVDSIIGCYPTAEQALTA